MWYLATLDYCTVSAHVIYMFQLTTLRGQGGFTLAAGSTYSVPTPLIKFT